MRRKGRRRMMMRRWRKMGRSKDEVVFLSGFACCFACQLLSWCSGLPRRLCVDLGSL